MTNIRALAPITGMPGESEIFAPTLNLATYLPWAFAQDATIEFQSDNWDLSGCLEWPPAYPSATINWGRIENEEFRLSAKEIAVLLLQPSAALELDVPNAERKARSPWALVKAYVHYSQRWLNWLTEQGIESLDEVTQSHADTFLLTVPQDSRNVAVKQVRLFGSYGDVLTNGGYEDGFTPWGATSDAAAAGKKTSWGGANKTPPLSDEVYGLCVSNASRVLELLLVPVLAAEEELAAKPGIQQATTTWPLSSPPTRRTVSKARNAAEFAATLLVCALTGMRATEISFIERGSVGVETLVDDLRRYRVRSRLIKGRGGKATSDTWVISETAANAIKALEALSTSEEIVHTRGWGERYARFVGWVNEHSNDLGTMVVDPSLRITPRHFRRTVAVAISRQQNGIFAAKSHLKHASVLTTEGYAAVPGGAASSLMKAAEEERISSNAAEVEKILMEISAGRPVSGLGANLLRKEIDAALEEHKDSTGRVLDAASAKQLVRKYSEIVHIGSVSNCWFRNPEQAKCLSGADDKSKPRLAMCEPTKCVNATVHASQAPVWVAGLAEIQKTIADPRVPEGERARLRARENDYLNVLEEIDGDRG